MSDSSQAPRVNVADRLATLAAQRPDDVAVAAAARGGFEQTTFANLDRDATLLARGLVAMGVAPGQRIALLVKPSVEFVALVFAILRSGATMVLVDAGLGKKNIVRCLEATQPDGFAGIPQAQALRVLLRRRFPNARLNVTVGRRWFWGGETLDSLRRLGARADESPSPKGGGVRGGGELSVSEVSSSPITFERSLVQDEVFRADDLPPPLAPPPSGEGDYRDLPHTTADDPAAIVFTSGSTGPPKGVLYRHETFVTQADEIQRQYRLEPGGVDLACFPLFGLFNVACGVTTVLPEMDFSRPASCDPVKLFSAANQWKCTQAFASPAVWDRLSRHAERTGAAIPTMREVFSCGAPVPAEVIRRTLAMVHPEAELHTPYGATESLPVATIEAQEILHETAPRTAEGAGVCVGRKFASIDWRVIQISDDPITRIDQAEELPTGEIGELIVRGPQVSRQYLRNPDEDHNAAAKIVDGDHVWHRVGDVGYFDEHGRFWYCGRKSHRVVTAEGTLFTECVEAVANQTEGVTRSALVGVGDRGSQVPVLVVERNKHSGSGDEQIAHLVCQACPQVRRVLVRNEPLPVDIRHNSKIHRESIALWAAKTLGGEA